LQEGGNNPGRALFFIDPDGGDKDGDDDNNNSNSYFFTKIK
jgi:hypothetical protein